MAAEFRSWVEVSRPQIAENFRAVRSALGPGVEITAVVKSDAYGHGAAEVSRVLAEEGARWFAVSTADEGVALREAGIEGRILVMADAFEFSRPALLEHRLTPVVPSLENLAGLNSFARSRNKRLRYHLKIDTGMGRLGAREPAAAIGAAIGRADHLDLEGLMSHFASAADYTSRQTDEQVRAFDSVCQALCGIGIKPALRHMSSTNPVAYGRTTAWYNMVRPGHALYGYVSPARGHAPPPVLTVKPALAWKTRVLTVKDLPEGARIGYGGMYCAPSPTRIAVLAVGYADGLPHRLSNRGSVIARGRLVPIVGAISMDMTTIDATAAPELRPGDAVTLLGAEGQVSMNAQEVARLAGTISYDVLCGIRARVKRLYL